VDRRRDGRLRAPGLRLRDAWGRDLPLGGGALVNLARVDTGGLLPPPPGGTQLLVDVTAPLAGPTGAAATYGPQKGARPTDIGLLDRALLRFAELTGGDPDQPGAGAAGGTSYGLATLWGARIMPGARTIAALVGLADALARADVVITGEGHFDRTSLTGKVVGSLLDQADAAGVPGRRGRRPGDRPGARLRRPGCRTRRPGRIGGGRVGRSDDLADRGRQRHGTAPRRQLTARPVGEPLSGTRAASDTAVGDDAWPAPSPTGWFRPASPAP
ncbi:glycerate kinase, partial [Micromonospora sp. ATA51]|uniref:glycerate kinase n=1 Tax=Micromonospora sp. ATA51 TaxID=2806098 RepID=UPI001A56989A